MAGIYNGYILEFPQIRVDCFTSPPRGSPHFIIPHPYDPASPGPSNVTSYPAPSAQLFLLTHVHSDHLLGLSNDFTGKIVCSPDTKRMLLRLEAEKSRSQFANGTKEVISRKYSGLAAKKFDLGKKTERTVDRIEALPVGYPKEYILGSKKDGSPMRVTITLLDANHCPGSTMFLITSSEKAVLHTGDIRCDKLFLQTLRRNPIMQEFIVPTSMYAPPASSIICGLGESAAPQGNKGMSEELVRTGGRAGSGRRVLDRIYLDTSAFLGTGDMPDKEDALQELLNQMNQYPSDTIFFLNVWCFGWEDVIKEVARYFDAPVHIDRYKHSVFSAIHSDPFLSACTTMDPHVTRFHACERFAKCEVCQTITREGVRLCNVDKRIVHVTMVEIKSATWVLERDEFNKKLHSARDSGEESWPLNIQCPIARHSPIPELQNLVRMFRPHAISPNALTPIYAGLDYFLLPDLLSYLLQPGAYDRMIIERDAYFASRFDRSRIDELKAIQADAAHLKAVLEASAGRGSDRDEFLPEPTSGARSSGMGSSRMASAADQVQRVAGFSLSMKEVQGMLGGKGDASGTGFGGRPGIGGGVYTDGYDTDEEERRESKRRRRRRESTPGSVDDDVCSVPSPEEMEEAGARITVGDESDKRSELLEVNSKPMLEPRMTTSATVSPKVTASEVSSVSSVFERPANTRDQTPPHSMLPPPIKREPSAVAGPSKPRLSMHIPAIPPYRPQSERQGSSSRNQSSASVKVEKDTSTTTRPTSTTTTALSAARHARPSIPGLAPRTENSTSGKGVSTPMIKVEHQSLGASSRKQAPSATSGRIFTDLKRMRALYQSQE